VEKAIESSDLPTKSEALARYRELAAGKSNRDARIAAKTVLGKDVFWDWDREFFFPFNPAS